MNKDRIYGGTDLERVFLRPAAFRLHGATVKVETSVFPEPIDMGDVFMRHLGRYGVALPFLRSGFRVLDFPCGSGLAIELLKVLGEYGEFVYEGRDVDEVAVAYASHVYASLSWAHFSVGDLISPELSTAQYDTIMCIEGIEHIGAEHQRPLIEIFHNALVEDGTLVISSPAPAGAVSGPNPDNSHHLCELTYADFAGTLEDVFGPRVEIIKQQNLMTTGHRQTCYYAVCHK